MAFALVIVIQQILVFPFLSRTVSVEEFSSAVLLVTVSTFAVNVVAGEASNVSLVRGGEYEAECLPWDAARFVALGAAIILVLSAVAVAIGAISWGVGVQYSAITLFGMLRTFGVAPDKFQSRFGMVVLVHLGYAFGAAAGLLMVQVTGSPYVPFVIAESVALAVLLGVRKKYRDVQFSVRRTAAYRETRSSFIQLGLVSVMMNLVAYLDRLAIVPLLGGTALAIYYAATVVSRSMSLVTNPLANTFLARVGRIEHSKSPKVFRRVAFLSIPAVALFAIVSYTLSFAGLRILYPRFFDSGVALLVPVALSAAFMSASDLMRPAIIRFLPVARFLVVSSVYALIYISAVLLFSQIWGLVGFAWASVLANATLFCLYWIQSFLGGKSASEA